MILLNCNICGGDIQLTGKTHGVCEYCGCEVTLPRIDDERQTRMYNRGNVFRRNGDFDKAYSAYEYVIADAPENAEAHWCLALCRYGVEYVLDRRTGDYLPTINRMKTGSILHDPDYLAAIESSDSYTRELYRQEAERIARIQTRYLSIIQDEQPYDVFICYKAQDKDGHRTASSIQAQNIYEALTEKGLRVFFSRITLDDKLAIDYEPYIYAALNSSKVMLLVASEPKQLLEPWVRNEWSRFLHLRESDRSKVIVPVYMDMDPQAFPVEIPTIQALDIKKVGAMQDLIHGVMTILGKKEVPDDPAQKLLEQAWTAICEDDAKTASALLDQVLNLEPANATAYLYLLLLNYHVKQPEELVTLPPDTWTHHRYFHKTLEFAPKDLWSKLRSLKAQHNQYLAEQAADALYAKAEAMIEEGRYADAMELLRNQLPDAERTRDLIDRCSTAAEHQRLRQALDQKYPETYIYDTLKITHPGVIETCHSLVTAIDHLKPIEIPSIPKLLTALAMMVTGIITFTVTIGIVPISENSLYLLIGAWFLSFFIYTEAFIFEEFSLVRVLVILFAAAAIEGIIPHGIWRIVYYAVLFLGVGILFACADVKQWYQAQRTKQLQKKLEHYYETVVQPLEDEIRSQVYGQYADLPGNQTMPVFNSVRYCMKNHHP